MPKFSLFILFLFTVNLSQAQVSAEKHVIEELNNQLDCWNNADLNCFMEGYWKSDSLMFIGKNGVNYGWQTTYDNYKKSYPDKEAMGILKFELMEVMELDAESVFVVGKWLLNRTAGTLQGHFSLLWKKIDNKWVIVADHTS